MVAEDWLAVAKTSGQLFEKDDCISIPLSQLVYIYAHVVKGSINRSLSNIVYWELVRAILHANISS